MNGKKFPLLLSLFVFCVSVTVFLSTLFVWAHEIQTPLPLGDGKLSNIPKSGYLMSCTNNFRQGPGASKTGSWVSRESWFPDRKPIVEGEIQWPNSQITIAVQGHRRIVLSNNLPQHATGLFPIQPGTKAFEFDRNPNHIGEQQILLSLPAFPTFGNKPSCVPMGMIGFAVSGVAIFSALDIGGRDAPAHEIQDLCNGHPEMTSQYHYHNWSPCLVSATANEPVGWMIDGFPILGPVDEKGYIIKNDDLDECHGRMGDITIAGNLVRSYHYRFTFEYPYTIGCFKGTPERPPAPHRRPSG